MLSDLDGSCVIDLVEGRDTQAAKEVLCKLTNVQRENIQAIALDMWKAYIASAKEVLPNADLVHDKFHVVGYLNKAVDTVRKKENKSLSKQGDNSLKNTKYIWLKNQDNLDQESKKTFRALMKGELKVAKAWSIKRAFNHFWSYNYKGCAIKYFNRWFFWATHSRIKPIIKVAKMIKRHFNEIISYLEHHITNAVAEGLNSKIQTIKANARGFRNFQNYRTAVLFHCGKLDLYP